MYLSIISYDVSNDWSHQAFVKIETTTVFMLKQ